MNIEPMCYSCDLYRKCGKDQRKDNTPCDDWILQECSRFTDEGNKDRGRPKKDLQNEENIIK